MILTVTLNPAVDKFVKVRSLKLGRTHRAKSVLFSAGGKGINVSEAIRRFSVATLATGFIGGMRGRYIVEDLKRRKVANRFIQVEGETRTSLTIIDLKGKPLLRVLEPGPHVKGKDVALFKKKYETLLKKSQYVVLSGRNIPGASDNLYCQLIRLAKRHHVKTVFDTSGQPLIRGLTAKPFLIKPNLKEAEYIIGRRLDSMPRLKKAMDKLLRRGIQNVIISLGARGAVASDGRHYSWAKPPKTLTANTVGCGDALIGGFLFALLKGRNFEDALRFGVAAGTANMLHVHAGRFTARQVADMAKRVKVTSI